MASQKELRALTEADILAVLNSHITQNGLVIRIAGRDPVILKTNSSILSLHDGGCWLALTCTHGTLRTKDVAKIKEWICSQSDFGGEDTHFKNMKGPGEVTFEIISGIFSCEENTRAPKNNLFVPRSKSRRSY